VGGISVIFIRNRRGRKPPRVGVVWVVTISRISGKKLRKKGDATCAEEESPSRRGLVGLGGMRGLFPQGFPKAEGKSKNRAREKKTKINAKRVRSESGEGAILESLGKENRKKEKLWGGLVGGGPLRRKKTGAGGKQRT